MTPLACVFSIFDVAYGLTYDLASGHPEAANRLLRIQAHVDDGWRPPVQFNLFVGALRPATARRPFRTWR